LRATINADKQPIVRMMVPVVRSDIIRTDHIEEMLL
jgi:hypothetical protein